MAGFEPRPMAPGKTSLRAQETYEVLQQVKEWTLDKDERLEETEGWVLIEEHDNHAKAYSRASTLRARTNKPEGRWDFAGRRLPDGKGGVFARFLG